MTTQTFARAIGLIVALVLCGSGIAQTMSKDQYAAGKDRIAADYKAAKAACDGMSGNAKDICKAEAKGKEDTAKAELEMNYKPSAKNNYNAKVAKADADYKVANEKCDDMKGNDKKVCVKAAKDARVHAKADAEAELKTGKAQMKATDKTIAANDKAADKIADANKDAANDKRKADYALEKAKCDALAGAAKDTCIGNAKARYQM
jgi:hypothetical protein